MRFAWRFRFPWCCAGLYLMLLCFCIGFVGFLFSLSLFDICLSKNEDVWNVLNVLSRCLARGEGEGESEGESEGEGDGQGDGECEIMWICLCIVERCLVITWNC